MTLQGKSYISGSLGISQVAYMMELKNIDGTALEKINDEIRKFIWEGKRPKVRKEITYLPVKEGGLNVEDATLILKAKRLKFLIHALKNS